MVPLIGQELSRHVPPGRAVEQVPGRLDVAGLGDASDVYLTFGYGLSSWSASSRACWALSPRSSSSHRRAMLRRERASELA